MHYAIHYGVHIWTALSAQNTKLLRKVLNVAQLLYINVLRLLTLKVLVMQDISFQFALIRSFCLCEGLKLSGLV